MAVHCEFGPRILFGSPIELFESQRTASRGLDSEDDGVGDEIWLAGRNNGTGDALVTMTRH